VRHGRVDLLNMLSEGGEYRRIPKGPVDIRRQLKLAPPVWVRLESGGESRVMTTQATDIAVPHPQVRLAPFHAGTQNEFRIRLYG